MKKISIGQAYGKEILKEFSWKDFAILDWKRAAVLLRDRGQ
jgi:hypothetical protein